MNITNRFLRFVQKCNSKRIKFFGSGTQKVEEELRRHFKSARIARLDQDVTKNKQMAEDILHDFGAHKYDILLGTKWYLKVMTLKM